MAMIIILIDHVAALIEELIVTPAIQEAQAVKLHQSTRDK